MYVGTALASLAARDSPGERVVIVAGNKADLARTRRVQENQVQEITNNGIST